MMMTVSSISTGNMDIIEADHDDDDVDHDGCGKR